MFIILSKRAERSIDDAESWWRRHRDKAPRAMVESLAEAFAQIREQPESCPIVVGIRRKDARRIYLPRVGYHLYYRVRGEIIDVIEFWHASRGSRPRL